ncbi:MAG: hypothetical protein ACK5T6_08525 [Pirellula sp.]|jgi:hypothetical protein
MEMNIRLKELWRIEHEIQFRQVHAAGNGEFVLAGGIDIPSMPQAKQSCCMAKLDSATQDFRWITNLNSIKQFDYSCVTQSEAIGCIPAKFKSDFAGVMRFDLFSGKLNLNAVSIEGIKGLASFGEESFAYGWICNGNSKLSIQSPNGVRNCELSLNPQVKLTGLYAASKDSLITTMQRVYVEGKNGAIEFLHQLRSLDCDTIWEYKSLAESVVNGSEGELLIYSDAGELSSSEIEVVNVRSGERTNTIRISTSIACLTPIGESHLLFCNPSYELCLFDRREQRVVQKVGFPKKIPGWLCVAVDIECRLLLACKADNFLSPRSTIVACSF